MSQFISRCSTEAISLAASNLLAGNLVAFPTETVYGLGADACNPDAVAGIYSVKGRPTNHPIIVHLASINQLNDWVHEVPQFAISLARDFWPGPMTLIFKRSTLAKDFITGSQDTVGIRVPNHPVALALLEEFARIGGKGIAAPSANRFGQVSATSANSVFEELGSFLSSSDQILDGGSCKIGVESTIIDCTSGLPRILRPGAITLEMIERSTRLPLSNTYVVSENRSYSTSLNESKSSNENVIRVSGSLESHYAPKAKVVLDQSPTVGQGFIALADTPTPGGVVRLASPQTIDEYATILYSALRQADQLGLSVIVVKQPLGKGLAIAIRDRLSKASAQ